VPAGRREKDKPSTHHRHTPTATLALLIVPKDSMRFSRIVVLCLAISPASAFLWSTKPIALFPSSRAHHRRAARRPLYMAGEIIDTTKAALDALPLILAPTAALAAGAQGLGQKKTLKEDETDTEMALDDIKQKISNADAQIAVS
jgi:hypothetical protein